MENVIEVKNVSKYFGSLPANKDISINIKKATVHAIIGENGAGKSTLMNILAGLLQPTQGSIYINGKNYNFISANDAAKSGVGMVHQEFMLYEELTVLENIILGNEGNAGIFIDKKKAEERVKKVCDDYKFPLPLKAYVKDLPVSLKQQVEIVKVLCRGADIIILDEPTAVLTPQGIEGLFKAMRFLISKGKTILFITHKLKEVMTIADEITVLKDGKVSGQVRPEDVDEYKLAGLMVGRSVMLELEKTPKTMGEEIFKIENLHVLGKDGLSKVNGVSFTLHAGEILGLAGVAGNGQTELVEALVGLTKPHKGSIFFGNIDLSKKTPRARRLNGIGYVPQDRLKDGCNPIGSLWENAIMGYHITNMNNKIFLNKRQAIGFCKNICEKFSVKVSSHEQNIRSLSGGNIQKLIVGREFMQDYKVLVIEDPTRGIDVGTIEFIWKQIQHIASMGVAIILVGHELHEVLELSDRVLVMYEGKINGEVKGPVYNEQEIGLMMTGGSHESISSKQ